jgi:hypothetical protein
MQTDTGIIQVIQKLETGERAARIDCASGLILSPGKYILAYQKDEADSVLGWPLFPMGLTSPPVGAQHTTRAQYDLPLLGPIPSSWNPGTQLHIHGPLGHGFQIPHNTRRLAVAAFGDSAARLLPLIHPSLENEIDIAVFSSVPLPQLPPAIEIHKLRDLKDNLPWADFLAIDIPVKTLPDLRRRLGLDDYGRLPCQAQVLVTIPMPCAGIGDCGACAVQTQKRNYRLACKDGPVFDLKELDW